jgi:hypothetical protein
MPRTKRDPYKSKRSRSKSPKQGRGSRGDKEGPGPQGEKKVSKFEMTGLPTALFGILDSYNMSCSELETAEQRNLCECRRILDDYFNVPTKVQGVPVTKVSLRIDASGQHDFFHIEIAQNGDCRIRDFAAVIESGAKVIQADFINKPKSKIVDRICEYMQGKGEHKFRLSIEIELERAMPDDKNIKSPWSISYDPMTKTEDRSKIHRSLIHL